MRRVCVLPSVTGEVLSYHVTHQLLLCYFSHLAYCLSTRKKLLHTVANPARGLLNREIDKVWQRAPAPPQPTHPTLLVRRKFKKTRDASMCLGATQVWVRLGPVQDTFGSSTRSMGVASQNSTLLVHWQLSRSRCLSLLLVVSSRVCLFFPPRDLEPPPTPHDCLNPHRSLQRRRLPFPSMPNFRMSLCTQLVHSFSFPPRPLRTAPSRFPNTIRFRSHPPLIRMSAPAHKRLLVRNFFSILSHRGLSPGHGCTRSSDGLVSCAVPR